jgi:ABC-2 type transport system permease protein
VINVMRSEWIKLRRRGMLAAFTTATAVTMLGTVLTVVTAGQPDTRRGPGAASGVTLASLTSSRGLVNAVTNNSTLLGVIALAVFAASFAGEYSNGTLRNLLINEPRRILLVVGKFAAMSIATIAALVIATGCAVGAAVLAAAAKGIHTGAWWSTTGWVHTVSGTADLAIAIVAWGLLGAVLALAFRSPVAAVGIGIAYALPLENILGGVINGASRWLPGKLLAAIASGGNDTASFTAGLATITAYAILTAWVALVVFRQRDVAS